MVSALQALLLLTFAVAAMAFAPASSPTAGVDLSGEKFMHFGGPVQCWKVIEGVEGCYDQLLRSLVETNLKFLPKCCKAIVGLPWNCIEFIFPFPMFGISFGDQVNKICDNLLGGKTLPAS